MYLKTFKIKKYELKRYEINPFLCFNKNKVDYISTNSKKRTNMAEIPEKNPLAAAADIVATLSNLSEKQCSSSEEEKVIKRILDTTRSMIHNPQELKQFLANLARTKDLSDSVHACLDLLMPKVNKLCVAEEKVKISPKDPTLISNVKKIEACVNAKLTELQSENGENLTADRINFNYWTNAEKNVEAISKAILQRQGVL